VLALAAVLLASTASAQTTVATFDKATIGGDTLPADVLRVLGIGNIGSGSGTINPLEIDNLGDVRKDTNTTVSTAGAHTWGAAGQFSSTLGVTGATTLSSTLAVTGNTTITGNLIGGSGTLLVTSPTHFTGSTVGLAALGASNVRVGVNTTSPRVILEDVGSPQWEIDNVDGLFRLVRMDSAGTVDNRPFQIDGNINLQPMGRRLLPVEPYGVDIGSQQYKFGALWTGDLYADRLVTIENIGTIDNRWLIGSGNVLDEDLSPSATTMITRYNNYATGTFIYLQKFARTEFIKTGSGPTLTNKIANGSFENGLTSNWATTSATASAVTTKSFHGEYSMLVDASANPSFVGYSAFSFTTATTYTVCFNARRVDGATMADGAVGIFMRDSYVDAVAQQTQTDGWARFCRTAAAGANATTVLSIATKGVDMYIDAVQVEETSTERTYSEYRASYTIARNQEGGSSVANQWYRGDGMFGVGAVSGDGWLDCYAIRGIKAATEQGPACVANVRTGSSYNSWAPRAVWGNLDGLYGYSGTTYGFAAGDSTAAWLAFDSTNGIRGMSGSTKKFGITMAGVASFVEGAVTIDNTGLFITNSSSSTGENLAYTFKGGITYIKRPGLFYSESSGTGELALAAGDRSSGVTNLALSAAVGNVNLSGIHVTVTTVGGNFWMNGVPAFSGTKVMGACTVTFTNGVTTNVTGC
jgi:hypothetical protein